MDANIKKRWISLYVENQVGVLSKISGLFSAKSYNLDSLTVGTTEDPTISRMTIATVSDDETFEQIKKQLNRQVEVIKVIDFTDVFVRMKEILYIKVRKCTPEDKTELFQIAETFKARVIDISRDSLLLEFVQTATKNDAVVKLMKEEFKKRNVNAETHEFYIMEAEGMENVEAFLSKAKEAFGTDMSFKIIQLPAVLTCHAGLGSFAVQSCLKN